ncbi:integrase, catalytic region, zinc finger, CCHC-type containing protein [Tanacetum coccineum]
MMRFENDQFALILRYEDLVQGNVTINRVYYVDGLNINLFSVGQFCDADLEFVLWKSTCFVRDLQGNDLLTCTLGSNLYIIALQETSLLTPICFMAKVSLQAQVITVQTDRGTKFLNKILHAYFKDEGIELQTSIARTPKQNGVVERQNRTLVEAARTMLLASKLPLFFWVEAIATACYTQKRSLIIPRYENSPYHIINDKKPTLKHLHIFSCTCYITRDVKT